MAKVDTGLLKELREEWRQQAEDTEDTLGSIKKSSDKVKNEAQKLISNHASSKYALSSLTDRVINKHTNSLEGLKDIHTSLQKVQEISEHFRAVLIPKNIEYVSDGKTLWDNANVSFTGDIDVISLLQTNTDKERELYYIFKEALSLWSYIRANDQQLEGFDKYLANQVFGINRLDSMIGKLENLRHGEMFADTPDMDNIDGASSKSNLALIDNSDIEDDDGMEGMRSNCGVRRKKSTLGNRVKKVR